MASIVGTLVFSAPLLALWVALTGQVDGLSLLVGAVISLMVAILIRPVFAPKMPAFPMGGHEWRGVRPVQALLFAPRFFADLVRASWEVALLALSPGLSLYPAIVRVETAVTSKTKLVFLANMVTLTPGTMTLDARMCDHHLFVHVLTLRGQGTQGIKRQVAQLEARVERVFR